MKKTVSFFLAVIFIFAAMLPSSAENINISTEKDEIIEYFSSSEKSIDSFESVVAVYAVGSQVNNFDEKVVFENDKSYAGLILVRLATGKNPLDDFEAVNPADELIASQKEDGSFGTFGEHFYAMAALEGIKALKGPTSVNYSSAKALEYLLSLQKEDGSFGNNEKTAKAICILNDFAEDTKVSASIDKAKNYIINSEFTSLSELCYKVQGIVECDKDKTGVTDLVPKIIEYKNSDGSYPDDMAVTVLLTLDATLTEHTAYGRLIKNGSFSNYTFEMLKPFLIAVVILVILSIAFWVYIMTSKKLKRKKDLNDIQDVDKNTSAE